MAKEVKFLKQQGSVIDIESVYERLKSVFKTLSNGNYCGYMEENGGYDDSYFHNEVIPTMKCKKCGETLPKDYRPLTTKYQDGFKFNN